MNDESTWKDMLTVTVLLSAADAVISKPELDVLSRAFERITGGSWDTARFRELVGERIEEISSIGYAASLKEVLPRLAPDAARTALAVGVLAAQADGFDRSEQMLATDAARMLGVPLEELVRTRDEQAAALGIVAPEEWLLASIPIEAHEPIGDAIVDAADGDDARLRGVVRAATLGAGANAQALAFIADALSLLGKGAIDRGWALAFMDAGLTVGEATSASTWGDVLAEIAGEIGNDQDLRRAAFTLATCAAGRSDEAARARVLQLGAALGLGEGAAAQAMTAALVRTLLVDQNR